MGQTFASIPTRNNSDTVDASWWNILQAAGAFIESLLGGAGYQGETAFTIANNQSSPANVTGLSFTGNTQRSFEVTYQVYRNTTGGGATELAESGKLLGVYSTVAGSWEMTQESVGNSGVTFSITNAGQVQYTSTNITGTAATSAMKFKFGTMGV